MRHAVLVIACALPMTACNKSPEVSAKNASVAEVAQKVRESGVASDNFLHAGQWRVSSTVEEMTIPGMPPEAQAEMKKFMGQQNASYEYCLTPEEAKKPGGKFFTGKDERNCRYDHFTMSGGKFDAAMRCQGDASGAMTMAMNGTYSPDSYSTHVAMNMEGGREGKMSMKMRSEAKRIGECSAKRG